MINRNLLLLFIAFASVSCASNKQSTDSSSSAKKSAIVKEKKSSTKEEKISSNSADEAQTPHIIYFDTDSAKITSEASSILDQKVLPEAKSPKAKKIVIEAHCDERGSNAYNQKLSEKRAKSVKSYLVKNGIKDVKIKTVGYGESKPVALGHDEESWSKNRRAITIVIKK
ncbi:MAG: pal [Rickettsiaceae bacterium]|jgi:peptidoglycan-associated lipoprotein|nr:pal [Rickettsiaceae bacterium]